MTAESGGATAVRGERGVLAALVGTPHALLRAVAIAEAVSWTLLIVGMLLRAATGWRLGVTIGGGVHGFVFLAFVAAAVFVSVHQRWRVGSLLLTLVAGCLPFASLAAERWLARTRRLDGAWRTEPGDDPRDATLLARAMREVLRRPLPFGLVAAAVVAAVFVALLLR